MVDIPVFILTLHCYLASVSVDMNGIPLYQSATQEEEIYKTINLNQHMYTHSNKLELGLKNDWGESAREKAFCEIKIRKSSANGKNSEIASWSWKEKDLSIGFSEYTKIFEFSGHNTLRKQKKNLSSPDINQAAELLKNIQTAIEGEDIDKLINVYFMNAFKEKYESHGYIKKQWLEAEMSYWKYIFSKKVSSHILGIKGSIVNEYFIHLLSEWKKPSVYIKLKDGNELFLDIIITKKNSKLSVYSVEYIQKEKWEKM